MSSMEVVSQKPQTIHLAPLANQNGHINGSNPKPLNGLLHLPHLQPDESHGSGEKRRQSFPLTSHPRDQMTPPKSRQSMSEVVARMRVREKTLLGEDILKRKTENHVSNNNLSENIPTINIEDTSLPQNGDATSNTEKSRSKKSGFIKAWGTPRDQSTGPVLDLHLPQTERARHLYLSTGTVVEEERRSHQEVHPEEPQQSSTENIVVDDASDDDDDFDFDEGEEEVAAEREETRRSSATWAVYLRACEKLRIQPSPAFLRQWRLSVMDLRDVRLGPADVKPVAIALVRDSRLYSLDLSYNNLGPIGVSYVAEMLQENSTLVDVNLSATNPGREGVKALSETLRHNHTLASLRLEENGIEHTESHLLADIIRFVPTLRSLFLGHNKLGYAGGAAIAAAIAQNTTMQILDLQWNHIRKDSSVALVKALTTNKTLRTLNLAWNGLGKEGCLALAHVLPKNSTLIELDLTCNRVDVMALGFLLNGVTRNTSLRSLRIGQNPLTTDGAKALIRAVDSAPQVNISHIDIRGVPVDIEFAKLVSSAQETRVLHVRHEEAVSLATSDRKREHDGTNLDRYDPVMVFFEYMKLDNLRVIDMFQFMDTKKKDKLTKGNIRDGLNTLKIPVTEHAIDIIFQKLDLNKDGYVELDEMMKVQRDTARQVKLRQIKAKSKNKEDEGLNGLHKTLRDIISKRKEEKEPRKEQNTTQNITTTKTSVGGKKASVGGLQLTQATYSVTSSKRGVTSEAEEELPAVAT